MGEGKHLQVRLRSCDPGTEVDIVAASSQGAADAVTYASLLNTITAQIVVEGAALDAGHCYGTGLLDRFGVTRLSEDVDLLDTEEFGTAAAELALACRLGG